MVGWQQSIQCHLHDNKNGRRTVAALLGTPCNSQRSREGSPDGLNKQLGQQVHSLAGSGTLAALRSGSDCGHCICREMLMMAAYLRMPGKASTAEKEALVKGLIKQLGQTVCTQLAAVSCGSKLCFALLAVNNDSDCGNCVCRETLMMAAHLRMPGKASTAEKGALVEGLIKQLGLTKSADTIVGDKKKRGLSGGEKKRLSIGAELIAGPMLLFTDEPTTGLDSFQAEKVVQCPQLCCWLCMSLTSV